MHNEQKTHSKERPLFLLVNDDGVHAKGIQELMRVAAEFGDVVVVAPDGNRSGKAHSLTSDVPMRVRVVSRDPACRVYACSGTPVDCVKLGVEHYCDRRPALVLSGINHGSNASVNVVYSGTMGAALEATQSGYAAIGFSLLNHHHDADFSVCLPYVKQIIEEVLRNGLPERICLNVNFPDVQQLKGIRVCRASQARWTDSCEKRTDPYGYPYYWLTGRFECHDKAEDTDQWALEQGYVSIVPCVPDFTAHRMIAPLAARFHGAGESASAEDTI